MSKKVKFFLVMILVALFCVTGFAKIKTPGVNWEFLWVPIIFALVKSGLIKDWSEEND